MTEPDRRSDFKLHQYDQMWNNINRHIFTVWYSVAALGGSASLLALVGSEDGWRIDFAAAIAIILGAWLLAHVYDAQHWFDRNISIVEECEAYFSSKPIALQNESRAGRQYLIGHLALQRDLAVALLVGALLFHLLTRLSAHTLIQIHLEWTFYLPYVVLGIGLLRVKAIREDWKQFQRETWTKAKTDADL